MMPVIVGVAVALVIALFFGLRGSHASKTEEPSASPVDDNGEPVNPAEAVPGTIPPPVIAPSVAKPPPPPPPSPQVPINELSRTLRMQRLWASLSFQGDVLVVRSSSCGETELANAIAGASAALRETGLTKLRCVEQSGRVVFERDI
jgi:type IV secretory pathway VirB10-like protein